MKANRCRPAIHPAPLLAVLTLAALGACVPASAPPPRARPAPPPRSRPVQPQPRIMPRPVPQPATGDWRDLPQSPGDWTWSRDARGMSRASFGTVLSLGCMQPGQVRMVVMDRSGAVTIRTTSVTRAVAVTASDTGPGSGRTNATIDLAASDPLLDAMAFSRGRFVLEFRGSPPLVVPSWPEISRVIEDCR